MSNKYLASLLFALLFWAAPLRAQVYPIGVPDSLFICALVNIGATLTQCQAIPVVATQRYFITDVSVQSTTATANGYSIQSGTGANCGTSTTAVFPWSAVADKFTGPPNTAAMAKLNFTIPLQVTAGHALCILGVATNLTSIQIQGYVK